MITSIAPFEAHDAWQAAGLELPMLIPTGRKYIQLSSGAEAPVHLGDMTHHLPITLDDTHLPPAQPIARGEYLRSRHPFLNNVLDQTLLSIHCPPVIGEHRADGGMIQTEVPRGLIFDALARQATTVSVATSISPDFDTTGHYAERVTIGTWDNGEGLKIDVITGLAKLAITYGEKRPSLDELLLLAEQQRTLFDVYLAIRRAVLRHGGSLVVAQGNERHEFSRDAESGELISSDSSIDPIEGVVGAFILPWRPELSARDVQDPRFGTPRPRRSAF